MKSLLLPLLTLVVSTAATVTTNPNLIDRDVAEFDWDTIAPSSDLKYHKCYGGYQCARLLLPLDWLNETNSKTVAIAITKLPAVVDDDDPSFGGTIFTQPGGPAVSGTLYIRRKGHEMRDLLSIPGKRHYEILAFDIRGNGQSTPRINCWPGVLGPMRSVEGLTNGGVDLSPASLAFAVAAAKADGRQCEMRHGDYLTYVGTPNIARDMVAMIDKIAELRRETARLRDEQTEHHSDDLAALELRSTEHLRGNHGKEEEPRLQYIGISYGTVLGNHFASMFPGRVGRMVLDGVCDANEFASGIGWLSNTIDADEIAERFFQGCFAAGNPVCALHRDTDSSGADISRRFWAWASSLDEYPIIAVADDGQRTFARLGDIRNILLWSMYDAVYTSQALAVDFDDAMRGNTTGLLIRIEEFSEASLPRDAHKACSNKSNYPLIPKDSQSAIICIDGKDVTNLTNSDWRDYVRKQISISSLGGAFWATLRISCAGWTSRPNWPFKGPFTTPPPSKSAKSPEPGHPAAPLLFISTRLDPVTPLRNARSMAEAHPGAGVMVLESTGHCVTNNAVGSCAKGVLSAYFDIGAVPSKETTCEPTRGPWDVEETRRETTYLEL